MKSMQSVRCWRMHSAAQVLIRVCDCAKYSAVASDRELDRDRVPPASNTTNWNIRQSTGGQAQWSTGGQAQWSTCQAQWSTGGQAQWSTGGTNDNKVKRWKMLDHMQATHRTSPPPTHPPTPPKQKTCKFCHGRGIRLIWENSDKRAFEVHLVKKERDEGRGKRVPVTMLWNLYKLLPQQSLSLSFSALDNHRGMLKCAKAQAYAHRIWVVSGGGPLSVATLQGRTSKRFENSS